MIVLPRGRLFHYSVKPTSLEMSQDIQSESEGATTDFSSYFQKISKGILPWDIGYLLCMDMITLLSVFVQQRALMETVMMRIFWSGLYTGWLFIGPRCPWGPIYGSWCQWLSPRGFADLTDVTLADEDSNSIPTDDANGQSQAMWQCKWRHLVANIKTNASWKKELKKLENKLKKSWK